MRLLRVVIFTVVLLFSTAVFAQTDGASLDDRGYGLYIPSTYDEDGNDELPLVIALHGFGDTWENFYPATGFIPLAEQENFIVAFPQGYLNQWNDGSTGDHYEDDVQLLRDLVERVDRDYRVDYERIYLVGFSNGGVMAFRAACEASDLFAGIVAIAGTMRIDMAGECPDNAQLPVLMIHGTGDTVVSFNGDNERLPVPLGVQFWAGHNDCDIESVPEFANELFQGGFFVYWYSDCLDDNYVMLLALEDVGHIYPGAGAYVQGQTPEPAYTDTARFIWGFFQLSYEAKLAASENPETTPEATAEATEE